MPDQPPNTLTPNQAAKYVGARSVDQFRREVKAGIWPQPFITQSRPHRWRRADLDQVLRIAPESPHNPDQDEIDALDRRYGLR